MFNHCSSLADPNSTEQSQIAQTPGIKYKNENYSSPCRVHTRFAWIKKA
jgi:hypothetical protein